MTGSENSSSNAPNGLGSTEALVVSQLGGPFELKGVQLKDMRRDEIVVKMIATGICHTDLATAHVSTYLSVLEIPRRLCSRCLFRDTQAAKLAP
jgi:hypothetical protein